MGGPLHSRSRSRNRKVHHQERSRQDASGSKRKTQESHRGKRRHRLRAGQELHRGNMAGGLAGKLRQSETQTVHVQDQPGLPQEPHQAADRQHSAGRPDFSGLTTLLQTSVGRRAGRPHRGQEKAERSGAQDGAKYPPDDRFGVQPRHRAAPRHKNPTQGCALPKVEHKEMKTLTSDQLSTFFQEARDSGVYELYYLDLATGLRRGELLGLKWTDVDLDRGVLKILRAISRQNGKVVEAPLKTKNAYRTLPLSADAISVLKMQKCKVGNSEWVFPSPTGGPMSPDSVLHMLQRVLKRAGLPRIRFHDLRHTFATMALQNGVDVKTVSSMLGHYSAGFTLDTYAHVTTDAQLKAAQTMGNILSRAV